MADYTSFNSVEYDHYVIDGDFSGYFGGDKICCTEAPLPPAKYTLGGGFMNAKYYSKIQNVYFPLFFCYSYAKSVQNLSGSYWQYNSDLEMKDTMFPVESAVYPFNSGEPMSTLFNDLINEIYIYAPYTGEYGSSNGWISRSKDSVVSDGGSDMLLRVHASPLEALLTRMPKMSFSDSYFNIDIYYFMNIGGNNYSSPDTHLPDTRLNSYELGDGYRLKQFGRILDFLPRSMWSFSTSTHKLSFSSSSSYIKFTGDIKLTLDNSTINDWVTKESYARPLPGDPVRTHNNFLIKVGSSFKESKDSYIKSSGIWRKAENVYYKRNGNWNIIY